MGRRITLNAFEMTCVGHQSPGMWRHPESRASEYNTLEYWVDVARILERGKFDALFIADVLGVYDVYQASAAPPIVDGDQIPLNDPFFQIPAMAYVTDRLGFVVTSALTFEQPYAHARKFSTLDHLTDGRIGWNIVTSFLDSAARNLGMTRQIPHDERYDIADEFLEVSYKLWEGSWEDDAVIRDRARGIFSDPSKIHPIGHVGAHYTVPGIHLSEPSPQRTPALFQAGASPRGREFSARHAEGIFINAINPEATRIATDDIRDRVERLGRSRDSVKIIALFTAVVADSDAAAEAKYKEYLEFASREGALTLYGGWSGLDLSAYAQDQPLRYVDTDAVRSTLAVFTTADPDRDWTPLDVANYVRLGGIGPVAVGSPETVADEIERWIDTAGLDGINLAYTVTPGAFEEFVDLVVPELQKRGRVWRDYEGATLREYVNGVGHPRVADNHPAARFRGAYIGKPSAADTPGTTATVALP